MKHRKTQLAAAVGAGVLLGAGAVHAQVQPGQQNIQVQLYGQINRALMYADDEVQSKVFHVDNPASSSRFGLTGTGTIMPGLRAGALWETEFKSNASDAVTFALPTGGSSP